MYFGICVCPNGRLYCALDTASNVLVVDPETSTLSFIEGAIGGSNNSAGILARSDGILACVPRDSTSVLLLLPFSERLIWDQVASVGGRDFELRMRVLLSHELPQVGFSHA